MLGETTSAWEGTRFEDAFAWANQTNVHPLALAAVVILGLLNFCVPRRYAAFPLIILACMVTSAQSVYVVGLNFHLLRIGILILWARLIMRGELQPFRWIALDKLVVTWAVAGTCMYTLQSRSVSAFILMSGQTYDALGMYFAFRCLIRSWNDLEAIIACFAALTIPVALAFAVEFSTGHNPFGIFGYVPELTPIRWGKLRCQGAFAHPILAGCFWASLIPLLACRWWAAGRWRIISVISVVNCLFIVFASNSSTPLMAIIVCAVGALAFRLRRKMRAVRWTLVVTLIVLHLFMKAPVWSLLARIDLSGGSTGWHRYHLIDAAIRHFFEWALVGVRSTLHWGWGLDDVTNQYVLEGVRGGALTLALFLAGIVAAFRGVANTWRAVEPDRARITLAWALGIALCVHCVNFVAVTYFGQIKLVWFFVLAAIASVSSLQAEACQTVSVMRQGIPLNSCIGSAMRSRY